LRRFFLNIKRISTPPSTQKKIKKIKKHHIQRLDDRERERNEEHIQATKRYTLSHASARAPQDDIQPIDLEGLELS
jgi:hypothetical protein